MKSIFGLIFALSLAAPLHAETILFSIISPGSETRKMTVEMIDGEGSAKSGRDSAVTSRQLHEGKDGAAGNGSVVGDTVTVKRIGNRISFDYAVSRIDGWMFLNGESFHSTKTSQWSGSVLLEKSRASVSMAALGDGHDMTLRFFAF